MQLLGMNWTEIILIGLATFRLTRLIVYDKITAFLRAPFFDEVEEKSNEGEIEVYLVPKQKGIRKWIGELLDCYWCTGVWVSLLLVMGNYYFSKILEPIVLIFAIAAIIETITQYLLGDSH